MEEVVLPSLHQGIAMSSRASTLSRIAFAGLLLGYAAERALAHEVLHEVRRGEAVAVRVYESDGDPVAQARFEVYSPSDPKKPWATGLTDRAGWVAFVPTGPGRWRVRVIPADGHGLDVQVEGAPPAPVTAASPAVLPQPVAPSPPAPEGRAGSALGPLLGVGLIALIFAALVLARRRQERRPPSGPGP
jgi:nickel transport protein